MKNANLTSSNNGSSPWELRSSRRGNGLKGGEGMLAQERLRHRDALFICAQSLFYSFVLGKIMVKIGHMRGRHADRLSPVGMAKISVYSVTSEIVLNYKYNKSRK